MSKSNKKKIKKWKQSIGILSNIASTPNMHVHTNDNLSLRHVLRLKHQEQQVIRLQEADDCTFSLSSQDDDVDSTAALVQWLEERGVQNSTVDIRASAIPGAGNGVFVADGIQDGIVTKGTTVITVPTSLMISSLTAMQEPTLRPLFAASSVLQQQPSLQLALLLLREAYKADKGEYHAYISTFPSTFTLPLWWDVNKLQKLRGMSALRAVARNVVSFARYYCHIHDLLSTQYANGGKKTKKSSSSSSSSPQTMPFPLTYFTINNFKWAMSVVMTRQNPVPYKNNAGQVAGRCLALVPVMDMVNHGAELEHGVFYDDTTDTVNVACTIDTKAGEEVRMYYGDRTNQELLVHSGFVASDNRNDAITIVVQISGGNDPLHKVRLMVLRNEGIVGVSVECEDSMNQEEKTKDGAVRHSSKSVVTSSPCGYDAAADAETSPNANLICPVCSAAGNGTSRVNFEFEIKYGDIGQLETFVQIQLLDKDGIRAMLTKKKEINMGETLAALPLNGCVTSSKDATRADKLKWAMQRYLQCALCRLNRYATESAVVSLVDVRREQEAALLSSFLL
jgi:hypothetical protein